MKGSRKQNRDLDKEYSSKKNKDKEKSLTLRRKRQEKQVIREPKLKF